MNVCYESNFISVSFDNWWLDIGDTIHACNSEQVMIRKSPTSQE